MSKHKGKVKRKKFLGARFTATISIALVLFVLALIGLGGMVAAELSTLLREQFIVTLVLNDRVDEVTARQLAIEIGKAPYAHDVRYVGRDEALRTLTDELGENPEEFLGYNPLSASIELRLDATHAVGDSVSAIAAQIRLRHADTVAEVDYNRTLIDMVNTNLRRVAVVLIVFAALLLVISISLINNTIRLSLHADRFLIHTMRLVGATAWFIRRPFVAQGAACGFVAALLALGGVAGLLYYGFTHGAGQPAIELLARPHVLAILAGGILVIGIFIPAAAAWRATDKYLRMKTDDLYLI